MKISNEILKQLSNNPLFKNIPNDSLKELLPFLNPQITYYEKDQILFHEGDHIKNLGIVIKGSLHIETIDYFGNINIKAQIGPGEIFGETFACLNQIKANCQVKAQLNSQIIYLDLSKFLKNENENYYSLLFINNLVTLLAKKNYMLTQKIDIMNKRTTRDKLLEFLFQQEKEQGSSTFTIPFNRQQLADYLAVDRSGLSSEISKLIKEGIITADKQIFHLL